MLWSQQLHALQCTPNEQQQKLSKFFITWIVLSPVQFLDSIVLRNKNKQNPQTREKNPLFLKAGL